MDIKKDIAKFIKKGLAKAFGEKVLTEITEITLDTPKCASFGQFSTNIAFVLSKSKQKSALEIARKLTAVCEEELKAGQLAKQVTQIKVAGDGFINFFLSKSWAYQKLGQIVQNQDNFGRINLGQSAKVHIEFVSANPTGPLNVAHARQAAFGDSLANLLDFAGYKVTREYYLNDEGVQIDLLGESVYVSYLARLQIPRAFPSSGYRGRYIDNLAGELLQRYGRRLVRYNKKRLTFFSNFAYRRILKGIKQDLDSFGVKYDHWFSQKGLNRSGKINRVLNKLKKDGFVYQKQGAWWLATTKFGDDKDRVVIKSDRTLTYITPDIAYHQAKFKRKFSRMINIWGPDHHGYIPRVRASISALGYEPRRVSFLIVQLVSLTQAERIIPMSTRLGQYISLADIIQAVGKDMARFFFLMRKRDSHLHFDLALARKQSLENPVYYIQYAHARTHNILKFAEQAKKKRNGLGKNLQLSLLDKPEEIELIQRLTRFPSVIESCAIVLEPHRMTTYLHDLAKDFHHYYERHRVVTDDKELTRARLALVEAVRIVLNNGLGLLGVRAPVKM